MKCRLRELCGRRQYSHVDSLVDTHAALFCLLLHVVGVVLSGWAHEMRTLAPSLPHVRFILPAAPVRARSLARERDSSVRENDSPTLDDGASAGFNRARGGCVPRAAHRCDRSRATAGWR